MFKAWWFPFSHYGVIHGDPHLGNYTVFDAPGSTGDGDALGKPAGINLLDYGCIRTFPTKFVQGVIDLYTGLKTGKRDLVVHAYETWGFTGLSSELIDVLNIWARFIYGPLLDDREREIAEGTTPGQYGRKEAFTVHKALKEKGPGAGAARVRVHGPGGDRPRRRVPASRRAPQLARHLQRDHRGLHDGRRGRAPEGGVRGRGRALAGGVMRSALRNSGVAALALLGAVARVGSAQAQIDVPKPVPAQREDQTVTIVLTGDVGINSSNQPVDPRGGYKGGFHAWAETTSQIAGDINGDLNFFNLETVVTDRNDLQADTKEQSGPFNFRMHPEGLRHLVGKGFNLVSLANNHSMDYGVAGLKETLRHVGALRGNGILAAAGLGMNREEASRPYRREGEGQRHRFRRHRHRHQQPRAASRRPRPAGADRLPL